MDKQNLSIFKNLIEDHLKLSPPASENQKNILRFINCLGNGESMDDFFFNKALDQIRNETKDILPIDGDDIRQRLKEYWKIFYPEGLLYFEDRDDVIRLIREDRSIEIENLNDNSIKSISQEMTFTSNVLLTVPGSETDPASLDLPDEIKDALPPIMNEKQLFWFDHPIQIGEIQEKNEIVYGLQGLSQAFAYEKELGNAAPDDKLDVLLSVSVTHRGLQALAAPYLRYELSQCAFIKDLNIYIFTEEDCLKILDSYSDHRDAIAPCFGVDGEYARHYNFLKAVNVLWQTAQNSSLKGTFKIDLDQVFPQEELVKYTGKSAFQHFQSPLWGASGRDGKGRSVDLSLIAGALVNESDIRKSLYTPDVSIPDLDAPLSDLVFFKHLTMSLSTRGELMTRYSTDEKLDGSKNVISRIHVTGGTNGILVKALLKYKPFTPSFIGRAEDQAYILSVLSGSDSQLRYYHEDGLIMRHDKDAFAGESIAAAKDGTYIADIMRILYYTYYAKALDLGIEKTKEKTSPFTGSYISRYPVTLSYMRLFFKLLEMYEEGYSERADKMMSLGILRLQPLINKLLLNNYLSDEYRKEKSLWALYYNEIETWNQALSKGDKTAVDKREKLRTIFSRCLIT